ncbi:MAG: chloride channel protein [Elainellaceae cyanobacterium]
MVSLLSNLYRRLRALSLRPKRIAIFEACAIGLVSGLAAVLLRQGAGALGGWRIQMSTQPSHWWALPVIGFLGGGLAGLLVEGLSPEAEGSGIPQVKMALANMPIRLNLRVALVKLIGVILVMGSGLNLGRQGPTVHIGAALAAQFNQWIPTSPEYRRQLLASGAAAGLAAGFNAPIAGVLFVVEELLQDFSGLTLGTAILASFIGAVVSRILGGRSISLTLTATVSQADVSLQDVPFFVVLGLLAGVLGALFGRGIVASRQLNRRLQIRLPLKVAIAGAISGAIAMLLPAAFRDSTGLPEFLSQGQVAWQLVLLAFGLKFLLTLIACGAGAPGGIFAPALILGSSLGVLVGTGAAALAQMVDAPLGLTASIGSASTYSLAGMGAFFSAVTKGPITAIVIIFEMTADFNLVLPLMITSVTAYLTSDLLYSGSIYNRLLALQGISFDPAGEDSEPITNLTAAQLMQPRVETLSSHLPLHEVVQAFSESHHRGFPVVNEGKLVGIVTRSDLSDSSRRRARRSLKASQLRLADIMTPQPVTVRPADHLSHILYLLNRFKISRLPVTDGQRLVGIITRADIIRAESDQLSGTAPSTTQAEPSYLVYQTRSPATGRGRLLVLLGNPHTAPHLLQMAAAIARSRGYELECLQIIKTSRSRAPCEATVHTQFSRRLLRQAEQVGREWHLPVHTQIRAAHDIAQATLEVIEAHHIDLTLMGWQGRTKIPGRVFGNAVDTLIRQANCEVIVVKLQPSPKFENWLFPVAGGPNSQRALRRIPALVRLGQSPMVTVCQVFDPAKGRNDKPLRKIVQQLGKRGCPVQSRSAWGATVSDGVLAIADEEKSDVIILGASRAGILMQTLRSNIPEAIARNSSATVILVRGPLTLETSAFPKL